MRERDPNAQADIGKRHDGHNPRIDDRNTLLTSKDNSSSSDGEHDPQDHRSTIGRIIRDVIFQTRSSIISLQFVEAHHITGNERDREHDAHPTFAQTLLDVISRTTTELPIFAANLEDLRKR